MATPAYPHFSDTLPATTQGITAFAQSVRDQDQAMRDVILSGLAPGWSVAYTYDGNGRPSVITASSGDERHRQTVTWGTTGGSIGRPVTVVWDWSNDAGATWDTASTATYTWDANGRLTAVAQTAE